MIGQNVAHPQSSYDSADVPRSSQQLWSQYTNCTATLGCTIYSFGVPGSSLPLWCAVSVGSKGIEVTCGYNDC